jgi:hypothetical protein
MKKPNTRAREKRKKNRAPFIKVGNSADQSIDNIQAAYAL